MTAKPSTHACDTAENTIARLNDAFRRRPSRGTVIATAEVIALARAALPTILALVREYVSFTADNDPYGEHDFGALQWGGERLFWRIDYYDRDMRFGSPDPADPSVTTRVLTIMRADEY